ncbi:MAG: MBL fold metallo-hydrolase, partial [Pseudonocardia sp.]
MTTGTVHDIAPGLCLIEGHHPHSLWDDPDLPTIVMYRSGPRLYLLDTGVGPEQRDGIRQVAARWPDVEEILLLNSHGHLDHLGNNDVLAELPARTRRHFVPRAARSALDFATFFGAMYKRGLPYFDYLDGLDLTADGIASLLRALGADTALKAEDVAALGARIGELGITPAISPFVPSLVVDILLNTYPPVFPSVETMT